MCTLIYYLLSPPRQLLLSVLHHSASFSKNKLSDERNKKKMHKAVWWHRKLWEACCSIPVKDHILYLYYFNFFLCLFSFLFVSVEAGMPRFLLKVLACKQWWRESDCPLQEAARAGVGGVAGGTCGARQPVSDSTIPDGRNSRQEWLAAGIRLLCFFPKSTARTRGFGRGAHSPPFTLLSERRLNGSGGRDEGGKGNKELQKGD